MNADLLKKQFVAKYKAIGEDAFYKFLLMYALNKLVVIEQGNYKGITPNIEFMDYYDRLVILYRREGDIMYLEIAKIFRKVAHKIYRIMLKKNMSTHNNKFLNLV